MKKNEVCKIVESNIEAMKIMLGLDRWDIGIKYDEININGLGNNFGGQCCIDVASVDSATIILDPKKLDNEAEVLDALQHELVHCITSGFNIGLYAASGLVSKKEYQVLHVLNYRADEEVTTRVCKILDGIRIIQSDLTKTCIGCSTGPQPDKPLSSLAICPDCLDRWYKRKSGL